MPISSKRVSLATHLPCGAVSPSLGPFAKARAYVDLLLAPPGEAVLMGEAAEVTATIGYEALEHCTGDDLEVLTAFCGLANAVENGDSSPGGVAVIAALKARPEALASL